MNSREELFSSVKLSVEDLSGFQLEITITVVTKVGCSGTRSPEAIEYARH